MTEYNKKVNQKFFEAVSDLPPLKDSDFSWFSESIVNKLREPGCFSKENVERVNKMIADGTLPTGSYGRPYNDEVIDKP